MCCVCQSLGHVQLCDRMDRCSPPGSSVHGFFFHAKILEGVAVSYSRGSSSPRDRTASPAWTGRFFTAWDNWEALFSLSEIIWFPCEHSIVKSLSRVLCNSKDCSLPGSSVHGIFQARILEWAAIPFSRGSS